MTPYVDDHDFTLYLGDALELLPELAPASVDAIVTSPPYADQRPGHGGSDPDDFADWLAPFLVELARVVTPTGSLMLNLGRIFRDGEEHPYMERTLLRAAELGWRRIDTIVWNKLNAHPFVAPQYLHNQHEIVYWLARDVRAYRNYTAETRRPPAPETIARRGRRGLRGPKNRSRGGYVPTQRTELNPDGVKPGSVFACYIGREKGVDHDSPMTLELADYLVALACPPGGVVLDPFAGACTTAVSARRLGRRAVAIELDERHCRECARRLSQQALPLEA